MTDRENCLTEGSSIPYRNYPGVTLDLAKAAYLHRLTTASGVTVGNSTNNTAAVSRLSWDSSILQMECGRADLIAATSIEHTKDLAMLVIAEAKNQNIEHLSVRFDAEDTHLIQGFLREGFEQVDSILTFVAQNLSFEQQDGIRLAAIYDASAVKEIARTAFVADRFHSDLLIKTELADELHAQWGENSVIGKAADAVVVAEENDEILGFVTCKTQELVGKKIGTIVLVATSAEARGKGLGTAMIKFALGWFSEQGCDLVDVGTQSSNVGASKLYENVGFCKVASSVSLRKSVSAHIESVNVR